MPKPKPFQDTTVVFSISMPAWLGLKLGLECSKMNESRSSMICRMLKSYLGAERPLVFDGAGETMSPEERAILEAPLPIDTDKEPFDK